MDAPTVLPVNSASGNLFDLVGLKTYDLKSRPSRAFIEDMGHPVDGDATLAVWLDSLPCRGAGADFRKLVDRICQSKRDGRGVTVALGGRAIEAGCASLVADWVRRGIVQAVALSGAAAIHDFELAFAGKTCEEVADQLACGRYGMARDTADAFAVAARMGVENDIGLGAALGRHMRDLTCAHAESSVILAALQAGIPCTVHVALGAEVVHVHPHVCVGALSEASMIDFRRLCSVVATSAHGVWLNIASANTLPETLLKCVGVVRNFGHVVDGLLTAHLDDRGNNQLLIASLAKCGADGIAMAGSHELIFPLLHAAVSCRLYQAPWRHAQAA